MENKPNLVLVFLLVWVVVVFVFLWFQKGERRSSNGHGLYFKLIWFSFVFELGLFWLKWNKFYFWIEKVINEKVKVFFIGIILFIELIWNRR